MCFGVRTFLHANRMTICFKRLAINDTSFTNFPNDKNDKILLISCELYFNKFIDCINMKRKQYVVAQKEIIDKYLALISFGDIQIQVCIVCSIYPNLMYCFLQHFPVDLSRNVSITGTILETLG